ncbi:hypothetical protein [Faecalimonas sp.]
MGEIKQTNFRIDEDNANKFRKFCEEEGFNQAQGFDHLIQVLEFDKAKMSIPTRAMEMEEFERHTKALLAAFLNSLEIAENTEERVMDRVQTQMENKDQMLFKLQEDLKAKEMEIQELKNAAEELQNMFDMVSKNARDQVNSNDKLTKALEDKEEVISILKEKIKETENKGSEIDLLNAENQELKESLAQLKENFQNLEREKERSSSDYEKKILEMELEKEKALANLEKSHIEEITKIYEKFNFK